jgi:hypothetical protein
MIYNNIKDITGLRSGRLVAVNVSRKKKGHGCYWLCRCDCGNTKEIRIDALTSQKTKSCGCLQSEWRETGKANRLHGKTNTTTYRAWKGIKSRCLNPRSKDFKHYGGRGITMCKFWQKSFVNFYNDMGECKNNMTIERIDNNKGYDKTNCKWTHFSKQNSNKRTNIFVKYNNKKYCLKELTRKLGLDYDKVHYRYKKRGIPLEKAIQEVKQHG